MNIAERIRHIRAMRREREKLENASFLYQVKEYQQELWLTFAGNLVCPCSMLGEPPVEAISKMRDLYMKRV